MHATTLVRVGAVLVSVGLAVGLVAAVAAGAGVSPSMDARDPYRATVVTPDAAVAAVKTFVGIPQQGLHANALAPAVGTSDLVASGPFDGALLRYYKVVGLDVSATVDVHDGHVTQLLLFGNVPHSLSPVSLTSEQARTAASLYLAAHNISTDGLAVSVTKKNRGDVTTYQVSWDHVVNGATVPDSRLVELDSATGLVFSVYDTSRPYSDPPTAAVSRAQAVSDAEAAASGSMGVTSAVYKVDSASLQVSFTTAGAQQLIWLVGITVNELGAINDHFLVNVDAMTGASTVVGRG